MRFRPALALGIAAALAVRAIGAPVTIRVDAAKDLGPIRPIWRFFGADEPNYATMTDGRRLLGELGALSPGGVYFRAHNLLNTGDGVAAPKWGSTNAYTQSPSGAPVYDWTLLDGIFDAYRANNVRPYVEIGFMPKALSVHPEPYRHHWHPGLPYGAISTGWAYPPKSYRAWGELVYRWARHCVRRYGAAEVERWYWETWNEPNGAAYWHGSIDDFLKLHDYAVAGVRRALPTARVGGPDVAGTGGAFMAAFLRHVVSGTNYATGGRGTPTDFISFHAKGRPAFVDGHVRMGIAAQLSGIDRGFAIIAAVPQLRRTPIVIGECDPDGCAACLGPEFGYRTGSQYASYTAACLAREWTLADRRGVNLQGALTWAFEFEDQPIFAGERVLATDGVDLPVLDVFRMFALLRGRRVAAASSGEVPLPVILARGVRGAPDVAAIAALQPGRLAILVWNYRDDDVPGPPAEVSLEVRGLATRAVAARLTHYRIDADRSNACTAWKRLGSPVRPSPAQLALLRRAAALAQLPGSPATVPIAGGSASVSFLLPRQAVSLLLFDWPSP